MTVIHLHLDSDSLEYHMKVAGPAFAKFADYVKLLTINVYGEVDEGLLELLRKKAQVLGNTALVVHEYYSGFARFGDS